MTDSKPSAPVDGCAGCTIGSRRDFLVDALRASAAALAAIGMAPAEADAMPLRWISAIASRGAERSYPAPATDGVQIDKPNEVILARTGKSVYAFALACPHQNTALRWDAGGNRFQCPKHKSRYREDGAFIEGRATRNMDRLAIRRDGATLVVGLDALIQQDEQPAEWEKAFVAV